MKKDGDEKRIGEKGGKEDKRREKVTFIAEYIFLHFF